MASVKKTLGDAVNKRANAKALKAANGPSLAPKGYKADTTGRAAVKKIVSEGLYSKVAGQYFKLTPKEAAQHVSNMRSTSKNPVFEGAVKLTTNNISKSGRKANTATLNAKAAKAAAKPAKPAKSGGMGRGSGARGSFTGSSSGKVGITYTK